MPTEIACPKCSSANVIFSKKRGVYVCEDCGHEFVLEKSFVPQRIFLSYGHDEHASLAVRLRDDLKLRGHTAWFDAEHLHAGLDWESRIEQGLRELVADPANSAVVLLLTPHSVRRPSGYCLNEVAYALAKGLRIIPVMVVETEPPLSICRVQWLDMRECIPIHEKESLYQPRFERLLRALEADQLDFEGSQSRLIATLNPIRFSADIVRLLKDFTGRTWVFDEVDAWLADSSGSKVFWITGAPGVGKSAISAWIRDHRREIAAFHFCDINSEEKRNPGKLVRSLVYQLSTQLPEYEARLARLPLETIVQEYFEAYTLFDKLLVQPLADKFPPPDRPVVVLIDALDEATYQRQNEIVRFLALCADKTPPWLRFLVTSRPEPEIVSALQRFSPYVLDTSRAENIRDLCDYLAARLPGITPAQAAAILKRSEGVFLYVRHVVDAILAKQLSLDRPEEFPRGLGDGYQQFFQRQFGADLGFYEQQIAPLLRPVLAAFEPLTLGFLKRHCGIETDTDLFRLLNRLGSLFPASGQDDTATLQPFHRSITDWIAGRDQAGAFVIAATDGHGSLASQGWEQFERGPETMDGYFLAWLPSHLRELGEGERLTRLLKDFRFLMHRMKCGKLDRTLEDFRKLPPKFTSQGGLLEFEAAFFRENAHILRRGTAEWPEHRILFQLAIEHADDSPLTIGAERWLADGRCDWIWLWRNLRLPHVQVSPCLAVLEGHSNSVHGALALADGRILSWSPDKTLRLWDGQSGQCLAVLEGHSDSVDGVLPLADDLILSWSYDNTLRLWDGKSGQCLTVLEGHSNGVKCALALADSRILSWSYDNTLRLWDGMSRQCLADLKGHSNGVKGALALADGRILSWSDDSTLRLWDGKSGQCLAVLEGHTNWVRGALALADGRILSWSHDNTLRLWDVKSGQCVAVLEGHSEVVYGALALADGRILSWSGDGTLRLWDVKSGQCLAVLEGHSGFVFGALALPDGRILSWAYDNTLRLWDGESGQCLTVLNGHSWAVDGALALADSRILSWSLDKTLRLWDGKSGQCLAVLDGHSDRVFGALVLANGHILSWSLDKTLRLWDGKSGQCPAVLEGHFDRVVGALALTDGHILSWSHDNTLRLWDGKSGQCLAVLDGHSEEVRGTLLLADGRILSWSPDSALRLWDGQSGQCLAVLDGPSGMVYGALALMDSRILLWSWDNTPRIWDGQSGQCLTVLEGHSGSVRGVLALADGRILSWSYDETLRLWDGQSGQCLAVFEGHSQGVRGALALADGCILSWSWDTTLRLWDGQSGQCLAVLAGHSEGVGSALTLADGRILSWSWDKTLRLWDGQSGQCLAVLEGHSGSIEGALALADGRILSWSDNNSLRLWDGQSGQCLEVVSEEEAGRNRPEWLHARASATIPGGTSGYWFASSATRSASLRHKTLPSALAIWHTDSDANSPCLEADGTLVVTQSNGQVCFLQLHNGHHRITLAEAEAILVERGTMSATRIEQ